MHISEAKVMMLEIAAKSRDPHVRPEARPFPNRNAATQVRRARCQRRRLDLGDRGPRRTGTSKRSIALARIVREFDRCHGLAAPDFADRPAQRRARFATPRFSGRRRIARNNARQNARQPIENKRLREMSRSYAPMISMTYDPTAARQKRCLWDEAEGVKSCAKKQVSR